MSNRCSSNGIRNVRLRRRRRRRAYKPTSWSRWQGYLEQVSMELCAFLITVVISSIMMVVFSIIPGAFCMLKYIQDSKNCLGWEKFKKENQRSILPPESPESVRVLRIAKKIIEAMHDNLGLDQDIKVSYGKPSSKTKIRHHQELISKEGSQRREERRRNKLVIYDANKRLEGLDWEVVVLKSNVYNAGYFREGRIIVHTELLKRHPLDADLAFVIGHEVGHSLANYAGIYIDYRHWPRRLLDLIKFSGLYKRRREEFAADRNGMMLMAMAGYDPRRAPKFHEEAFFIGWPGEWRLTHPYSARRMAMLNKSDVMVKAMTAYDQRHVIFSI